MGKIKNVLLATLVMASIVGCSKDAEEKPSETKTETTESTPKEPEIKIGITKENYDLVIEGDSTTGAGGSSIDEVKALMGEEPTFDISEKVQGVEIYSMTYNAYETGEVLVFTFSNGKLAQKDYKKL